MLKHLARSTKAACAMIFGLRLWQFDDELLNSLWMLEATIARLPQATALLHEVVAGNLFRASDLPTPMATERRGPAAVSGDLPLFDAAGVAMEEDEEGSI